MTEFTQVYTRPISFFIGQVSVLEHKERPCKMCNSVRQKLDNTIFLVVIKELTRQKKSFNCNRRKYLKIKFHC